MNEKEFERLDKLAADALNEIANEDFDRVDKLKIGQLLRVNKTFIGLTRQLTRLADQGEPTRIVFATKVAKKDLIKCLDCDFAANETEFQILDKRGDYLKCPKCGAKDDRLSNPESTPPDALVEAVSRFLKENAITPGVISVSKDTGKLTLDVSIHEVEKLIDAHKKAVR